MTSTITQDMISQKYENGTLSYLLLEPDMLSGTGYKVLQGQERAGFACCVRVAFNGLDKLVYRTDGFQPLVSLVPAMNPDAFCVVVSGIMNAFQSVRQIGFLNASNIVCDMNRIFVEPGSFAVRLIYLPLSGNSLSRDDSFSVIKVILSNIIAQNPNLGSETVQRLHALLNDPNASPEQIRACVGNIQLPEQAVSPQGNPAAATSGTMNMGTATGLVSVTGAISNSAELSGNLSAEVHEMTEQPKIEKIEKTGSLFGIGKKRAAGKPAHVVEIEESGTEVLDDIFVPVIVLEGVGTPKKIEFLVNKQNYIIGKKTESVDGLIDFSNAVSRVHCRISFNDGRNFITDLGSANGSFLNGKKLEPEKPSIVNEGDKVKIADITFMVKAI